MNAPAQPLNYTNGKQCPSCGNVLPAHAKICVQCGIHVKNGRPLLTSQDVDQNVLYGTAESAIRFISWLIPFGLYPIASEAFGTAKPYVMWAFVLLTTLFSAGLIIHSYSLDEDETPHLFYKMALWAGDESVLDEIQLPGLTPSTNDTVSRSPTSTSRTRQPARRRSTDDIEAEQEAMARMQLALDEAKNEFRFHFYQYFSCTLVHGGWMHLIGNMLFFIIFGTGVNAVLGNLRMIFIYPLLALGSGMIYRMVSANAGLHPLVGASGAIMGLAGMYVILFPIHRIHMAAWMRLGWATGFRLMLKLWAVRGIWVVLFYIGLDVLFTLLELQDGVAHWAHLGGFITGVVLAIVLLIARQVPPQGDLISLALGKYAWPILGRPADRIKMNMPLKMPAR